jgi:hypothetical protein
MRNRIEDAFKEHMKQLEEEMAVIVISYFGIKYSFGTLIEISWKNLIYN